MISILVAIVTSCYHLSEVIALLLGGLVGMIWLHRGTPGNQVNLLIAGITTSTTLKAAVVAKSVPLWELGWFFLKVGSMLFGGGYLLGGFSARGIS